MTYAPARLLEVRHYVQPIVGLSDNDLGIVGDSAHIGGYHHGWDQRRIVNGVTADYSWLESTRDSSHKTNAARAFDLGWFDVALAGRRVTLIDFNRWLVAECKDGAPDTQDIRSVIYTPDRVVVKRWDRLGLRTSGDSSHTGHTHISYFADAEDRDKTGPFRRFFSQLERNTTMLLIKTAGSDAVYVSDGHTYRHLTSYPALVAAQEAGYQVVTVADMPQLEDLAGKPATDTTPVAITDEQLAKLAALMPKPPTAQEIADLLAARLAQ